MTVEVGSTYRLKNHVGYLQDLDPNRETEIEGLGKLKIEEVLNRHHPLFQGQIGTVVGISPVGEYGAGDPDKEQVIFEFEPRKLVNHEPGKPAEQVQHVPDPDTRSRRWSLEEDQIDEYLEFVAAAPPKESPEEEAARRAADPDAPTDTPVASTLSVVGTE